MVFYMQLVNIILGLYNHYCKKRTLVDKFHFIRVFGMTLTFTFALSQTTVYCTEIKETLSQ